MSSSSISPETVRVRGVELLLLVVAASAFALSGPLSKLIVGIAPVGIACGRCLLAAVVLFALSPRSTVRSLAALTPKQLVSLLGAGGLLAAHFAAFLIGLMETSLAAAVSLVSLEPLSVILAAWLFFRVTPSRREFVGVILATLGALIVATGAGEGEHRLRGDLIVLLAVVIYGAYVAAARGLRDSMPMLPYAATVYGVVALVLLPWAIHEPTVLRSVPNTSWGLLAALALVPTLVGHTLVQRAARHLSPALVALVSPGETVGALVLGVLLFGTWPSAAEAAGAVIVVVGATVAVTR